MSSRPELRVIEGRARPTPGIAPAAELMALGVGLTLTFALMSRLPSWYQGLFALAFGFYALAMLRLRRYAAIPRVGLTVFAVALAIRIAVLPVAPSLSGDIYRYVWEGRVVIHGGDPYRQSPLDPALVPLRDREIFPFVNHKELSTIYPPLAMAEFAAMAAVSPTIGAFKLCVVLHDLAVVLLLLAWARSRGSSTITVLAYAWNPLMVVEYAGSGHHDPTALAWLVLAFLLAESRPTWSAVALATGALIRLAPLLALPFLFARWNGRARLLCVTLLAAGLGLYWVETRASASGLGAYWHTWRNNELIFYYLERWTGHFETARVLGIACVGAALAWAAWRRWSPPDATRLAMRTSLLTSPVLHPWYLGWALLFEPLGPSAPWLLLSLTAILNYGVFELPAAGRGFHLPLEWRWVEYGVPLLAALALSVWHRARSRNNEGGT
jgi:hypothetical protein